MEPDLTRTFLPFVLAGPAFVILWSTAPVRIIRNEFHGQNEKLIRALPIIFLPFNGRNSLLCR